MSGPRRPGVFVTWNDSRRSATLSGALGVERVPMVTRRAGALRHLFGAVATARYLAAERPRLVWFQFSFVLGLVLAAYARLGRRSGVHIAADVHTKALRRSGPRWLRWAVLPAKRWALGSCCAVLVTNEANARYAEGVLRVPALVLPDPLPEPPAGRRRAPRREMPLVVFVCSYATDEPMRVILETARRVAPAAAVVLTGDPRPLEPGLRRELERVATLSGMLPEGEYWDLLRRADRVVVLTTEPACLPCGAYEAIAVGKRPVLAADPTARRVFGGSARFAELDPDLLAEAIVGGPEGGRRRGRPGRRAPLPRTVVRRLEERSRRPRRAGRPRGRGLGSGGTAPRGSRRRASRGRACIRVSPAAPGAAAPAGRCRLGRTDYEPAPPGAGSPRRWGDPAPASGTYGEAPRPGFASIRAGFPWAAAGARFLTWRTPGREPPGPPHPLQRSDDVPPNGIRSGRRPARPDTTPQGTGHRDRFRPPAAPAYRCFA